MTIVISKLFFSIIGLVTSYIILKKKKLNDLKLYQIIIFGFFSRWVILFFWFFFLDGNVSGDVKGYELHIKWVLEGRVPNRDFSSPYGFYFNYILSVPYFLFKHPIIIMIVSQLFELVGFFLFYLSIKKLLSNYRAKIFALLYFTNPLVIAWLAFDGQDESLMIFAFGAIFYAVVFSSRLFIFFSSCFSLFAVKITALAAVFPLIMVSSRRDIFGNLLFALLFLFTPLMLNSSIFGFKFERENGFDVLVEYFFPGNIWFLISQVFENKNLLLLASRLTTILLILFVTWMLFQFKNKISKPVFIAFGVCLYTFTFQIGSSYVSPGFIATIIPFLIFFLLINNITNKKKIYLFSFYSFIISFDLMIYLRLEKYFINIHAEKFFNFLFIPYELLIVFSNFFYFSILIKFFLETARGNNLAKLN